MTGGFLDGDIFRGLAFRILVFLSLALLPFGMIAVVQTREIARQVERSAELSLLGVTERASANERSIIQEGFGAAQALSALIGLYRNDPEACSALMAQYKKATSVYNMVAHLPADGQITCVSTGQPMQLEPPTHPGADGPVRAVTLRMDGLGASGPALVLKHPVDPDDADAGYIALSVPLSGMRMLGSQELERRPFDLVTFNAAGDVVTSLRGAATVDDLPRDRSLRALVGEEPLVFRDENAAGADRVYAVVPIVPGVVYSMSVWQGTAVLGGAGPVGQLSVLLPVLMWVASLIVAFWSINRLAIRHIRKLGRQMRHFAYNRAMPRSSMGHGVPRELLEIQQAFLGMAESIIRDEAALEDSLRDKNILLKEVHHRVKNNLQLISSIMNMQIRRAGTDDARRVLRRLQDRILSLATVHKNLYQNATLDRVDAGGLIEEIVGQLFVVGLSAGSNVAVTQSYDTVEMDTDDAAPLTLLVSEAVTNALKYIGPPTPDARARLDVSFERTSRDLATFTISNTTASVSPESRGTGLGSQLINAFARQLNAEIDTGFDDGLHRVTVRFPVKHRPRAVTDY